MTDWMLRAVGAALLGTVLAVGLKKESPGMALSAGIAALCVIGSITLSAVESVRNEISRLLLRGTLPETVLASMLRVMLAAILSKGCAGVCRDAGQNAVAYAVELCGAVCALILSIPAFQSLFEVIENMY